MQILSFVRAVCVSAALMCCGHALAAPQGASAGYTVKVKLHNPGNHPMLISYPKGEEYFMDTRPVLEDGYQVFRGSVDGIVKATFTVRNPGNNIAVGKGFIPGPSLAFVLRNGAHIVIEGDADKPYMATVQSDDPEAQAYEIFRSKDKAFEDRHWSMVKKLYATDPPGSPDQAAMDALGKEREQWMKEFVRTHPGTYAALEVFSMYAIGLTDEEQAAQFAALPATYKNTPLGTRIADKIRNTAVTSVGKPALAFSQPGSDGKVVDIAALKGKVVLLDFWGSWCGPCRESHPHLKEVYSKYRDKGFEIVGIAQENGSREAQEKAWRGAIHKDGITWLQVLNDKTKNDLVKLYGVAAFPTKILVDRKGVIRARFLDEKPGEFDRLLEKLMAET